MTDEGWKTKGAAEKYIETVDVVAPGRKEILSWTDIFVFRLKEKTA